jgi:hypothetical protein
LWCWRAALRQLPAKIQGLPRRIALEISIALELLLQSMPQAKNAHVGALSGPTCLRCFGPYAPELNPVENLWDELRDKCFHNKVFASLSAFEDDL